MAILRLDGNTRRKLILQAARKVADRDGVLKLTHEAVAEACEVETSAATVRRYFHTAADLRDALGV
jgi:DNA-binding transcriptional regulator YbjK